jgi:hypothetical protein
MNISSNNINFTSRKPIIRKADQIVRMMNNEFPSISPSKALGFDCIMENEKFADFLRKTQYKLETLIRDPLLRKYDKKKDTVSYYKFLQDSVRKHKIANCGELTKLTNLLLQINGIDAKPVKLSLYDKQGIPIHKNIDHVLLSFSRKKETFLNYDLTNSKDIIIIDPWLGLVDFAEKAHEKLTGIYSKFLDIPAECKILTMPAKGDYRIEKDEAEKLKIAFPEYIIDK